MSHIPQPPDLDAVRSSYDRVADNYAAMDVGDIGPHPWLRAALAVFAEYVRGRGRVLDIGCGPGTVTAHLTGLGVEAAGVDLSPRMIEHARQLHPGLSFSVASATDIRLGEESLAGVLGWWSLFNLPRDVLPHVLRSYSRALVPGGCFLMGTHVGDGDVVRTEAYGGVPVTWTTYLWQPEQLTALVTDAGFRVDAVLTMPPTSPGRPQVLISAQKPA